MEMPDDLDPMDPESTDNYGDLVTITNMCMVNIEPEACKSLARLHKGELKRQEERLANLKMELHLDKLELEILTLRKQATLDSMKDSNKRPQFGTAKLKTIK